MAVEKVLETACCQPNLNSVISNSYGFSLQSLTIGYFELPLFRTIFRFCEFQIAGFNCNTNAILLTKLT